MLDNCSEVVGELEFDDVLLNEGTFNAAGGHLRKQNVAHEEIICSLDGVVASLRSQLHQPVKEAAGQTTFSYYVQHFPWEILTDAGSSHYHGHAELEDLFVRVEDVIDDCQHELFSVFKAFHCELLVVFEASLQCLKGVLKAECTFLDDDPPDEVFHHVPRAVSELGHRVDEPSPVIVVAQLPLNPLEDFDRDEPFDDEVAEMQYGIGFVLVDVVEQDCEVLLREHFHRRLNEL